MLKKCTFCEELAITFNYFISGRNPNGAKCCVCPAGMFVSVTNKGKSKRLHDVINIVCFILRVANLQNN